jgi:hypothetical protein
MLDQLELFLLSIKFLFKEKTLIKKFNKIANCSKWDNKEYFFKTTIGNEEYEIYVDHKLPLKTGYLESVAWDFNNDVNKIYLSYDAFMSKYVKFYTSLALAAIEEKIMFTPKSGELLHEVDVATIDKKYIKIKDMSRFIEHSAELPENFVGPYFKNKRNSPNIIRMRKWVNFLDDDIKQLVKQQIVSID